MTEQKIAEIEVILAARKATGQSDWATIRLTAMVAEVKRLQAEVQQLLAAEVSRLQPLALPEARDQQVEIQLAEARIEAAREASRRCAEIAFNRRMEYDESYSSEGRAARRVAIEIRQAIYREFGLDAAREGTDG